MAKEELGNIDLDQYIEKLEPSFQEEIREIQALNSWFRSIATLEELGFIKSRYSLWEVVREAIKNYENRTGKKLPRSIDCWSCGEEHICIPRHETPVTKVGS
jgi:hypothetical protein